MHPFRKHHRRKLLETKMHPAWLDVLSADVPLVEQLRGQIRGTVLDAMRILVDEKFWEGGGGFEVTDRVRVVIAAQLAFQTRFIGLDRLASARSIIVYEGAYTQSQERMGKDGVVHTGTSNLGEAWFNGPVVLSWADALREAQRPGTGLNVVFHEFAHVVDATDGVLDGTPPLPDAATRERWNDVMTAAFEQVQQRHASGRGDVIRPYGLTNPAEFFAVTTEVFFDAPDALRGAHRDVFELFEIAWGVVGQ